MEERRAEEEIRSKGRGVEKGQKEESEEVVLQEKFSAKTVLQRTQNCPLCLGEVAGVTIPVSALIFGI